MKRLLLATAASFALAGAALAQTTPAPQPTTPPVATESTTPDPVVEGQVGTTVQTPPADVTTEAQVQATPAAPDNAPNVHAQTETQATTAAPAAPDVAPPTATAETTPDAAASATAEAAVPPAQAEANATAMAASPAAPTQTAEAPAVAVPATASSVCQPRVTSVHFGRGSSLSRENQNAIEHAVDASSVCTLDTVVIADSRDGSRRASAVRQTLIRQGVPAERITIAQEASAEGASTGQLDVRMNFAGVAATDVAAATAAQAPATTEPADPTNEAEPTPEPAS